MTLSNSACSSVRERDGRARPTRVNFSMPNAAALMNPATTERTASTISGTVMARRRLVGLAVAAVLAEEREVDAAGHVGGGEERADEPDDEEEVESGLARR